MKRYIVTFYFLLLTLPLFAQLECTTQGYFPLRTARDNNAIIHEIECWNPTAAQLSFPSGIFSYPVSSVFTRTGAVVAASGDYSLSQITATFSSPLSLSSNTLSCPTCNTTNSNVSSVFTRTGAVVAASGDYSLSQITSTVNFPLERNTNTLYVQGSTGTPTTTAGSGAGTSPTITLASGSTDAFGGVAVQTGSSPSSGANVLTLNFSTTYTKAFCVVSNESANGWPSGAVVVGEAFVSDIVFWDYNTALAASTTYFWGWHCDFQ